MKKISNCLKLLIPLVCVILFGIQPNTLLKNTVHAEMQMQSESTATHFTSITVTSSGNTLSNTDIALDGQSRKTDKFGKATFEHISDGEYFGTIYINGKNETRLIKINNGQGNIDLLSPVYENIGNANTIYLILGISLAIVTMGLMYLATKNIKRKKRLNMFLPKRVFPFIGAIGLAFILITLALYFTKGSYISQIGGPAFPKSQAAELASLPQPQNVKVFADNQSATVKWDAPANAASQNIVGYYLTWGKQSVGAFTGSKQTIYTAAQIQPLENDQAYTVRVQSVQGSFVKKDNGGHPDGPDTYAVANGNISPAISATFTPSSARVDAMRSRLTAFFDDFNMPAGAFDETKWNFATTACVGAGEDGQFINSQFHAHNAALSTNCDRAGNISRPRAIFDTAGRTESNPGQIEFDIDGVSQPRDVWYIDLIPTNARKNGMPVDVTSHNSSFDDDSNDPGRMLRIAQYSDKIELHYYNSQNSPSTIIPTQTCPNWGTSSANLQWCNTGAQASVSTTAFSPIGEAHFDNMLVIPNVRRHWVVQYSSSKIKVFVDGALMLTANTPSELATISKFQLHSTIFTYNTGKMFNTVHPTTSMLHWDNFGFNGPAASVVTHNYLDGGATGTTPLLGRGTTANAVPEGGRTTIIPIPDSINAPVGKARLMFTLQPFGYQTYSWNANDNVVVNGKKYSFPDPRLNMQASQSVIADTYTPMSTGIFVDSTDLVQGNNTIQLNIPTDILNVHLELDYDKSGASSYTQPKQIFSNFTSVVTPSMRSNDMYWFVEQDMGLKAFLGGSIDPIPVPSQTAASPTPKATAVVSQAPIPSQISNSSPTPLPKIDPTAIPSPIATSVPQKTILPSPVLTPIPNITPVPVASPIANSVHITAGDTTADSKGVTWLPMATGLTGSYNSFTSPDAVANTSDQSLYQSEKWGKAFNYSTQVPNGSYVVTLKFAEIYWSNPGQRVFNVAINSATVLQNFDILAQTPQFTALDKVFNINVTNGSINIDFSTVTDNAKISSIEIIPQTSVPPQVTKGDGLMGSYYSDKSLLSLFSRRVDPIIHFNWGYESPIAGMPKNGFSVRWQGYIVPRYSQNYTFTAASDDGVRVSINNSQIINYWNDRSAADSVGTISLNANQKYPIIVEYYENAGVAVSKLFWSSPSQAKEIVPQSQLYTK